MGAKLNGGQVGIANAFLVSLNGAEGEAERITIMNLRRLIQLDGELRKDEALSLAGWLVVLADPLGDEFRKVLTRIGNT